MTFTLPTATERKAVLEHDFELLYATLKNSKGYPEMSPEDTKMAIIALRGIVTHQQKIIEEMTNVLTAKKKKSFVRRFFGM